MQICYSAYLLVILTGLQYLQVLFVKYILSDDLLASLFDDRGEVVRTSVIIVNILNNHQTRQQKKVTTGS